ncbi:MAG: succinylglutamate desuccinylase [Limnospira sp.]
MIPTISTIPLLQLASGDRLSLQVYRFRGAKPGKKAYLQSNLHGAEISGNEVIHRLIAFLRELDASQLAGEIWLVPVCNPLGVNQRSHHFSSGRYHVYDGKDWNRIFWDYEKTGEDIAAFARSQLDLDSEEIKTNYRQKILQKFRSLRAEIEAPSRVPYGEYYRYQLQSLCLDADYVIDLHSSTNRAIDYLYCFHSRENSARPFLLDYGILMNEYDGDAFDEAFLKPWLALERELSNLGKPIQFDIESWTLELGSGMEMNPESVDRGFLGVQNYLASKGMLNVENLPRQETEIYPIKLTPKSKIKKYYAPQSGMFKTDILPGNYIDKNQKIYDILSFDKSELKSELIAGFAEAAGLVFDVARNQSVNQFDYMLSVMEGD